RLLLDLGSADLRDSFPVPPPAGSTLFPYTTLFRSIAHRATEQHDRHTHAGREPHLRGELATAVRPERLQQRADVFPHPVFLGEEDRKSTRLNSSHVKISYAVFCLKNKHSDRIPEPP